MRIFQPIESFAYAVFVLMLTTACADSDSTSLSPAEEHEAVGSEGRDLRSVGSKPSDSEKVQGDDTGFEESFGEEYDAGEEPDSSADGIEDDTLPEDGTSERIVVEEDGGIGGSGIYPPQPLPEQLGGDRPADVLIPVDYTSETLYPLVLQLHGYGGNASQIDSYFNLSAYVSSRQFILITPNGKADLEGGQYWNAPDCCDKYNAGDDDVAYLAGLIEEAQEVLAIDSERVFVVGLSNGAFMAHFMACSRPDLVRGIASLAGQAPSDPELCQPDQGGRVLQIHGTLDAIIPFNGSFVFNSTPETVDTWVKNNGCDPEEFTAQDPQNYDYLVPGAETSKLVYSSCEAEQSVGLWTLTGSGHVPFLHPDFTPDVLSWLFDDAPSGGAE